MKKNVFGRKLKRDTNERKALFKSLMSSLVLKERIKTTQAKAKAIKSRVDKLITRAKKDGVNAKRHLSSYLTSDAIEKLIKEIAPRFKNKQGGYARIIRLGNRFSDNAQMVFIEWTEQAMVKEDKRESLEKQKPGTIKKLGGSKSAKKTSKSNSRVRKEIKTLTKKQKIKSKT